MLGASGQCPVRRYSPAFAGGCGVALRDTLFLYLPGLARHRTVLWNGTAGLFCSDHVWGPRTTLCRPDQLTISSLCGQQYKLPTSVPQKIHSLPTDPSSAAILHIDDGHRQTPREVGDDRGWAPVKDQHRLRVRWLRSGKLHRTQCRPIFDALVNATLHFRV